MSEETPMPESAGFEMETGGDAESSGIGGRREPLVRPNKNAERLANLNATFGQGPGRFAIIAVIGFIVVFGALAVRGCSGKKKPEATTAAVDVPSAPQSNVSTKPVSADEAKRHAEQAQQEAEAARAKGQDYQTSFDPNIAKNKTSSSSAKGSSAAFDIQTDGATPHHAAGESQGQGNAAGGIVAIGGANGAAADNANANADSSTPANGGGDAQASNAQPTQAQLDAQKKHQEDYDAAVKARDDYVEKNRVRVLDEADQILGNKDNGQSKYQGYQSFTYASASEGSYQTGVGGAGDSKSGDNKPSESKSDQNAPKGPPLIKTGNQLYAVTNSLINTDHGGRVFATIAGGPWDGAQLIGDIEQAPDNIRVHFTTMAPQDNRPTMKIDAVALRESDAAQGIAENIDHHIFSRYTALAAASLLQGYGEAYTYQQGTSVVTANGTVLQTSDAPSNKQVIGRAVGQMGTTVAGEVQKGFDRPTTYSTPAKQGLIIYFLSDVYPTSAQ